MGQLPRSRLPGKWPVSRLPRPDWRPQGPDVRVNDFALEVLGGDTEGKRAFRDVLGNPHINFDGVVRASLCNREDGINHAGAPAN